MHSSELTAHSPLQDWLIYIESVHPQSIELGLERVRSVAASLDLLSPKAKIVTVAGTNGKGSTVAALTTLLSWESTHKVENAKRSVGCYTSPHLLNFNERIVVDGVPVSDAELQSGFATVQAARGDVLLTYFEFSTLVALLIFKQRSVDVIVLEVGLGGRLDAVNILDADIAIITSIALDHQDWLGHTIDEIALEKAGILRPAQHVIVADPSPPEALQRRLTELQRNTQEFAVVFYCSKPVSPCSNPVPVLSKSFDEVLELGDFAIPARRSEQIQAQTYCHGWLAKDDASEVSGWFYSSAGAEQESLEVMFEKPLSLADFKLHPASWSAAIAALISLEGYDLECSAVNTVEQRRDFFAPLAPAIKETYLTGRMSSHYYRDRELILDVAHNPAAIGRFVQRLKNNLARGVAPSHATFAKDSIVVFAAMADKDLDVMLAQLSKCCDRLVLAGIPDNMRAAETERLVNLLRPLGAEQKIAHVGATVEAAINWAVQATSVGDKIFVTGSFFTVAHALELLQSH